MKPLPICVFTKNRTGTAAFVIDSLKRNLTASGYVPKIIICDDGSEPGHVDTLARHAGDWLHSTLNVNGRGLGASMNAGLNIGFSMSDVVLRMEDDWVLQKPLEIGPWLDFMHSDGRVGAIRMGMMFRLPDELFPMEPEELGLLKLKSKRESGRIYNLNNQVALVHEQVYDLVGPYREGVHPQESEKDFAIRFNHVTENGLLSPHVCWPKGWALQKTDDPSMAFIHAGKSTLGHFKYKVPERYRKYSG